MASLDASQSREIAIFWDYENLALPSGVKPAEASRAIVESVSKHGRIVDRRLYNDFSDPRNQYLWSSLDSSGFDLVNTPRRNQKETLDKKLIADVLTFAWDSAVRNDNCKPAVVLLTSDGDFAYCVNKLRDRGVMSIVIYRSDCAVANILKDTADIALDLQDILQDAKATPEAPATQSSPVRPPAQNPPVRIPLKREVVSRKPKSQTVPRGDQTELDVDSLCQIVSAARKLLPNQWVTGATIGADFAARVGKVRDRKERYKNARNAAVGKGRLVRGRRLLVGKDSGRIVEVRDEVFNMKLHSKEEYIKLARGGARADDQSKPTTQQAGLLTVAQMQLPVAEPTEESHTGYGSQLYSKEEHVELARKGDSAHDPVKAAVASPESVVYNRDADSAPTEESHANALDAITLCHVLADKPNEKSWLVAGPVALQFRHRIGPQESVEGTERYRWALTLAQARGWLEDGRRILVGPSTGAIEHINGPVIDFQRYSTEQYLRLTAKGRQAVLDNAVSSSDPAPGSSSSSDDNYNPSADDVEPNFESDGVILSKAILKIGTGVDWVPADQVSTVFSLAFPPSSELEMKERFRQAWDSTKQEGLIEEGHRVLVGPNKWNIDLVQHQDGKTLDPAYYSSDAYLRLTELGSAALTMPPSVANNRSTVANDGVFLKNISRDVNVQDLVTYLEDQHQCKVATAYMDDRGRAWAKFWFAHVKFIGKEDAAKILELSNSSLLVLSRRVMVAVVDKFPNVQNRGTSELCYDYRQSANGIGQKTISNTKQLNPLLFIKNVPVGVWIRDLVNVLNNEAGCTVLRAKLDHKPHLSDDFSFAWVEVKSVEMAMAAVEHSKTSELLLLGRRLEVLHANRKKVSFGVGPTVYNYGDETDEYDTMAKRDALLDDVGLFCRALEEATDSQLSDWGSNDDVSTIFLSYLTSSTEEKGNKRFTASRRHACRQGYVEAGRRGLGDVLGPIEPLSSEQLGSALDSTSSLHLRFTDIGMRYLAVVNMMEDLADIDDCFSFDPE